MMGRDPDRRTRACAGRRHPDRRRPARLPRRAVRSPPRPAPSRRVTSSRPTRSSPTTTRSTPQRHAIEDECLAPARRSSARPRGAAVRRHDPARGPRAGTHRRPHGQRGPHHLAPVPARPGGSGAFGSLDASGRQVTLQLRVAVNAFVERRHRVRASALADMDDDSRRGARFACAPCAHAVGPDQRRLGARGGPAGTGGTALRAGRRPHGDDRELGPVRHRRLRSTSTPTCASRRACELKRGGCGARDGGSARPHTLRRPLQATHELGGVLLRLRPTHRLPSVGGTEGAADRIGLHATVGIPCFHDVAST